MEATTSLIEADMDEAIAFEQREDGVMTIQGALILCQGLSDLAPFQRAKAVPQFA